MASNLIKKFTEENFDDEVEKGLVLVDITADWCGPCRMLAPVLDRVAKDVEGKAVIGKLDIDHAQKTATKLKVTSVPTMILFKDGEEVGRIVGLHDEEAVKSFITKEGRS